MTILGIDIIVLIAGLALVCAVACYKNRVS